MEYWEFKQKQSLPLEAKIILSKNRIKDWYNNYRGSVYVAFSGGKDSTVLLHLVRSLFSLVPACFIDTGLEYPEIRDFVKTIDNVVWMKPKLTFKEVIDKYGIPVVSKEQSQFISEYRSSKSDKLKNTRLNGNKSGRGCISNKWLHLINAPFKISHKCCDILKKNPSKLYEKETGNAPFLGTMASESKLREQKYLRDGCNGFNAKRPTSTPLAFWTDKDIWGYIKKYNVLYSKIYDMGEKRTGCMFCCFGLTQEGEFNKFHRMKRSHPKQYKYCMDILKLNKVFEYLGVIHDQQELF